MNSIASYLVQLSSGTVPPGQNGTGVTGEPGLQSFDFWRAVIGAVQDPDGEISLSPDLLQNDGSKDKQGVALETLLSISTNSKTLADLVKKAESLLGQITAARPELEKLEEEGLIIEQLTQQIEILKEQFKLFQEAQAKEAKIPLSALILNGLTPSQVTQIEKRIDQLEQKLGRELTIEDVIAGVGGLIPQNDNQDFEIAAGATDEHNESAEAVSEKARAYVFAILTKPAGESKDIQISDEVLAAALARTEPNTIKALKADKTVKTTEDKIVATEDVTIDVDENLVVGLNNIPVGAEQSLELQFTPGSITAQQQAQSSQALTPREIMAQRALKMEQQQDGASKKGPIQAALATGKQAAQSSNPTTQGQPFQLAQDISITDDGMILIDGEPTGYTVHSGLPFSHAGQAAHSIAQSTQSAGQPHPATEVVSAKLQQAAQNGRNQTLTLQLEPAELGRVDVRLEFGKDKMVKATMLVEKPEAYLLLQRDSHALERALQNSGLELEGGGIDMQLAEDGSAFEQNNNGTGGGEKFGSSSGAGEADIALGDDILQSTMTWNVDPDSGHVRYNIVA